ncbi:MAG: hypothetical protein QOH51_3448 [Acidobacteriota bacterium]|jgi:hypothetical protein|nr:hypothetical protein [Acidobacteriota bacterium]
MFCPYCGTESTQGLNYCNRCGSNLSTPVQASAPFEHQAPSASTFWAVGVTMLLLVVVGLGVLFSMVRDFVHSGLPPEAVVIITMCGVLTILGSVFMMTRFWMRLLAGKAGDAGRSLPAAGRPTHTNELGTTRPGALPDAFPASVTEHTTRTLEHVKRSSQ